MMMTCDFSISAAQLRSTLPQINTVPGPVINQSGCHVRTAHVN